MRTFFTLLRKNRLTRIVVAVIWTFGFMMAHEYSKQQSNWAYIVALVGLGYLVIDLLIGLGYAVRNELRDWINRPR